MVKQMVMTPLNFNGKGSMLTLLAMFDNCGKYNGWTESEREREKFHYLTKALENPAAQVLWDLQSGGTMS